MPRYRFDLESITKPLAGLVAAAALVAPSAGTAQLCPAPNQNGTCTMAAPLAPLDPLIQPKFVQTLPEPVFYTPDKTTFPGFDYYEIAMSPVKQLPGVFPQAPSVAPGSVGKQWTGIVDALGNPLPTPVWGYGQVNQGGGVLGTLPGTNGYAATWPAMSFKGTRGTPVKVKWINDTPDQHLLCPNPTDSNSPCAIDRTLMGTKVDPARGEKVNPFGGPQQPDNAMVVHLHGGEIPPDSDGFAELWIGNSNTSKLYNPAPTAGACAPVSVAAGLAGADGQTSFACGAFSTTPYTVTDAAGVQLPGVTSNIDPPFTPALSRVTGAYGIPTDAAYAGLQPDRSVDGAPIIDPVTLATIGRSGSTYAAGQLIRPKDNFIFYNYPMVQESATIWYHDHALGKTRVNVAAGPAGFFYVEDPAQEAAMAAQLPPRGDCSNAGILAGACYDVPIALQDRAFNADGSINFPNGLGQVMPAGWIGPWNPLTPSAVPTVHPQWVPEYFGDMAVVNGVIWPKKTVEARPYRVRLLGGSNARCWILSLSAVPPAGLKGKIPAPGFTVIATEQGYVPAPVRTQTIDICPGERYEAIVDFTGMPAGTQVFMNNSGAAPYPNGVAPQDPKSPFAAMAQVMRFDVTTTVAAGAPALPVAPWVAPAAFTASTFNTRPGLNPLPATALTREMVLNEVLDPAGSPLRVQIDGKPFEAPVTETPKRGTVEIWKVINTTVDAHPIHLHLVQFKVLSRQPFNARRFGTAVGLANLPLGGALTPTPVAPFLTGKVRGPDPYEVGWKDTVRALPGEVTTIAAYWEGAWDDCDPVNPANTPGCKFTPAVQEAPAGYAGPTFVTAAGTAAICEPDALDQSRCAVDVAGAPIPVYRPHFEAVTSGPYVWHCHIVDHEDNEMMRPALVIP